MAGRQYGPEDVLYYGQKVMVNPEASVVSKLEPGAVGIVIDADLDAGASTPYPIRNPSAIPGWTVIVKWEGSGGQSGWQTKDLLAINEDVVPVTKYLTSAGTFHVIDGEVHVPLDKIMIEEKGEVSAFVRFNEDKRREMIKMARVRLGGDSQDADNGLPFE